MKEVQLKHSVVPKSAQKSFEEGGDTVINTYTLPFQQDIILNG